MRRLVRVLLLGFVAALATAGTDQALAQGGLGSLQSIFFGGETGQVISVTSVDASFSGAVVVKFHGDADAGCAARGVCGYSGVIVWRTTGTSGSTTGGLAIEKLRVGHHVVYRADLGASPDFLSNAAVSAVVRRDVPGEVPGTCADSSQPNSDAPVQVRNGTLLLQVPDGRSSIFASRCAGPRDVDLAGAMPTVPLALDAAIGGHRAVDFSGTHDFSAGGFTGTLHSTLVLHLGAANTELAAPPTARPRNAQRIRLVTEPLTIAAVSGDLVFGASGSANPDICGVLDSCGLHATLELAPRPVGATGALLAAGPARRPLRDFLKALGLGRRGRSAGIETVGVLTWDAGGTASTTTTQAGTCSDGSGLGPGAIVLTVRGRTLGAEYGLADPALRCPGPIVAAAVGNGPIASGAGPQSLRELTVRLRPPRSLSDDGYTISATGSIGLTLKPGRLRQTIVRL